MWRIPCGTGTASVIPAHDDALLTDEFAPVDSPTKGGQPRGHNYCEVLCQGLLAQTIASRQSWLLRMLLSCSVEPVTPPGHGEDITPGCQLECVVEHLVGAVPPQLPAPTRVGFLTVVFDHGAVMQYHAVQRLW